MSNKSADIEQRLSRLARQEQRHRAPDELKLAIRRQVHQAMREHPPVSLFERGAQWFIAHWWRGAPMGAAMAAIPLVAGLVLGYQLEEPDYSYEDPAIEWVTSYNSADDGGDAVRSAGDSQ